MGLREIGWGVWIGFDWLRIGTGGELLWMRWWTFGFLRHRISYLELWYSKFCYVQQQEAIPADDKTPKLTASPIWIYKICRQNSHNTEQTLSRE
jgi:hypothetical protein